MSLRGRTPWHRPPGQVCSSPEANAPRNDMHGNRSDYETMMTENVGRDLTLHGVQYGTLKRYLAKGAGLRSVPPFFV